MAELSLVGSFAIAIAMVVADGFTVKTFLLELHVLTRISFLVFMLVFITRPLHDLIDSAWTAWLLANRRYLGLAFAAWHLIHWPILTSMVVLEGPATFWKFTHSYLVPAFCVLLAITFMAATSSNRAVRWLGKRRWSLLHTIGLYAIWLWFVRIYVLMARYQVLHAYIYLGLAAAGLVLRWSMALRGWRRGAS